MICGTFWSQGCAFLSACSLCCSAQSPQGFFLTPPLKLLLILFLLSTSWWLFPATWNSSCSPDYQLLSQQPVWSFLLLIRQVYRTKWASSPLSLQSLPCTWRPAPISKCFLKSLPPKRNPTSLTRKPRFWAIYNTINHLFLRTVFLSLSDGLNPFPGTQYLQNSGTVILQSNTKHLKPIEIQSLFISGNKPRLLWQINSLKSIPSHLKFNYPQAVKRFLRSTCRPWTSYRESYALLLS